MFLLLSLFFIQLNCDCDAFIDSESYDSFNGWKISNSKLEGHYSSSVSLPASISDIITKEDLVLRKLIPLDSKICVYGREANVVRENLISREVVEEDNIKTVDDIHLPIVRPFTDYLVSSEWVKENFEDLLILHISEGPLQPQYTEFIPGTVHISSDLFESFPIFTLHPCKSLYPMFLEHGIRKDQKILIYGGEGANSGIPIMGATRFFMALRKCGVDDVRILNGGIYSWKNSGPIVDKCSLPIQVSEFGEKSERKVFVDEGTIQKFVNGSLLPKDSFLLLDDRSIEEYNGLLTGYSFVEKRGRIPGSKHLGEDFLALDGNSFRPYVEIERLLKNIGIEKNGDEESNNRKTLVFYCGTGWRASVFWFVVKHLIGWENSFVYDGGWNEWQRNIKNPIELYEKIS